MNKRSTGISDLREWARVEITSGANPRTVHKELLRAVEAVLQEVYVEHDIPGVRYWHVPETGAYFATAAGYSMPPHQWEPIELKRHEFLSRQGLHNGYGDRL